jgi:hypothetical protein
MANHPARDLKQFIDEALAEWLKERQRNQRGLTLGVDTGPPWPNFGQEIGRQASRKLSTLESSRKQLVRRLKRIPYPYVDPSSTQTQGSNQHRKNQHRKSSYTHVQSLGLLNFLLNPPFLSLVRRVWLFHLDYDIETGLRRKKKSQFGYPLDFHREMMQAIASALRRVSGIAAKHRVHRKWFAHYYAHSLRQLLRDASNLYPHLPFKHTPIERTPISRTRPQSFAVDLRAELFNALTKEFAARRKKNDKLAYQLTALICSPRSCITTRTLNPNPELVRRNMMDRKKKKKP